MSEIFEIPNRCNDRLVLLAYDALVTYRVAYTDDCIVNINNTINTVVLEYNSTLKLIFSPDHVLHPNDFRPKIAVINGHEYKFRIDDRINNRIQLLCWNNAIDKLKKLKLLNNKI